jgi:hypothetical protein
VPLEDRREPRRIIKRAEQVLLVLVRDWHHSILALVRALSSMQLRQPTRHPSA